MITIDQEDLKELLQSWSDERNSPRFVVIVAHTDPKLVKKHRQTGALNPNYKDCYKISKCVVQINWRYANAVNNARDRYAADHVTDEDGAVEHFTPNDRKWGIRVEGTPFVEHFGKWYLECRIINALHHQYRKISDNSVLSQDDVQDFLPAKRSNAEHQGLFPEKEVFLRDYWLGNIKMAKSGEVQYIVEEAIAVAS